MNLAASVKLVIELLLALIPDCFSIFTWHLWRPEWLHCSGRSRGCHTHNYRLLKGPTPLVGPTHLNPPQCRKDQGFLLISMYSGVSPVYGSRL